MLLWNLCAFSASKILISGHIWEAAKLRTFFKLSAGKHNNDHPAKWSGQHDASQRWGILPWPKDDSVSLPTASFWIFVYSGKTRAPESGTEIDCILVSNLWALMRLESAWTLTIVPWLYNVQFSVKTIYWLLIMRWALFQGLHVVSHVFVLFPKYRWKIL